EYHFERLSSAFAGFEGERFKQVLRHFEAAIEQERREMFESRHLFVADRNAVTADRIASRVWTDAGLSFRTSEPMGGLSENLPATLDTLFERFVTSQYQREQIETVSDEQVWSALRTQLDPSVARALRPKKFETKDFFIEFPHAFRNEQWHLVQPLSMDYAHSARIQEKAARWLGNATALQDDPQARASTLYLVLHRPSIERHKAAYEKAKNLLNKMQMKHEMFEDEDIDSLSAELAEHLHL
ncbi:MAG: hypothetical protein ACREMY_17390, partial [bacterium]